MNFQQIRFFLTLAETLNFTEAAKLNKVGQPTLTKSIKKLEDELEGRLFYRDGKNTRLTQLGFSLLSQFEKIDRNQKKLMDDATSIISGDINMLNLGAATTATPSSFTKFLDEFKIPFPNLVATFHTITTETISDLLLSGALDVCFCAGHSEEHPKLDYIDLFEERLMIAVPEDHSFRELDSVPLDLLRKENYIDRIHCGFRGQIMSSFEEQGLKLNSSMSVDRDDWAIDLVKKGCGATIIPERTAAQSGLMLRPISDHRFVRQISLVTVYGGAVSPAVNALRKLARTFDWSQ